MGSSGFCLVGLESVYRLAAYLCCLQHQHQVTCEGINNLFYGHLLRVDPDY